MSRRRIRRRERPRDSRTPRGQDRAGGDDRTGLRLCTAGHRRASVPPASRRPGPIPRQRHVGQPAQPHKHCAGHELRCAHPRHADRGPGDRQYPHHDQADQPQVLRTVSRNAGVAVLAIRKNHCVIQPLCFQYIGGPTRGLSQAQDVVDRVPPAMAQPTGLHFYASAPMSGSHYSAAPSALRPCGRWCGTIPCN